MALEGYNDLNQGGVQGLDEYLDTKLIGVSLD